MKKQQYQHAPKLDWTEESISGPVTTKEQKDIVRRLTAWTILKLKRLVKP